MAAELNRTTFAPPVLLPLANIIMASSVSDIVILSVGVILAALYLFRDQLFAASKPKTAPIASSKATNGSGNPRDFIEKMKLGVSILMYLHVQHLICSLPRKNGW